MNNDVDSKKEGEKMKPINSKILDITNQIKILYSNLYDLEGRLYPILEVEENDDCVDEAQNDSDKLYVKMDHIETDISRINYRIKKLNRLLMIEKFDG